MRIPEHARDASASNALECLLALLMRLRAHGLRYSLEHEPSDAVLVRIARPGERWEAAIFADGRIELETFAGTDGVVSGAEAGEALERLFSDTGSDA